MRIPLVVLTRISESRLPPRKHTFIKSKKFLCPNPACGRTFKHLRSRNSHVTNVCNKPPRYQCAYCSYKSIRASDMRSHVLKIHKDPKGRMIVLFEVKPRIKPFPCSNCMKSYDYLRNLREHVKYECGKPPSFKCAYCNYKHCLKKRVNEHAKRIHKNLEFRSAVVEIQNVVQNNVEAPVEAQSVNSQTV
ncbi:GSCOCG00002831001-RA-CDS [Cotesia congregata]|nr:GSCOCG00002831001-RA-CDS [Cotesia congregata]